MLYNDPIENMLAIGAVTLRSARIWMRVREPGTYTLTWSPAAGGMSWTESVVIDDTERDLTASLTLRRGIEPDTRYRVTLQQASTRPLASGSFVTAPPAGRDGPDHFSIALMSCHQPFSADGRVSETAEPMLEAVNRAFLQHRVRAVFMAGDQLYSDFPAGASLFESEHFRRVAPPGRNNLLECSAREVRQLFHDRYRHFWNLAGWRELLANHPCYPILDDHEIVDNWGSAQEHRTARWQTFRQGAFQAYADYQGSRICSAHADLPPSFDYQFEFADLAGYVMDLRSNRQTGEDPRLVSAEQLAAFEAFLGKHPNRHTLFVVLSVPLLHLPAALSRLTARVTPEGEDFSDRWSTQGHRRDRDRILRLLHDHQQRNPEQRIVLLSGDIHIGCAHEICWQHGPSRLYQFISSGVTHDPGRLIQGVSSALIQANRSVKAHADAAEQLRARLRLLSGEAGARRNPCGRLNVGIIEFQRPAPGLAPDMRFLLYSHRGPQPLCLFRSPPIPAGSRAVPSRPRRRSRFGMVTRPASQADR